MFDVVVVGAGPAGGMAAKTVATAGFTVAIIEQRKEVGYPVQCGEAITEFCLNDVGLKKENTWIKKRVKGVKIITPNGKKFYSAEPRLNIDRHLFDKKLVEKAVDKGAELHTNTKTVDLEKKQNKWVIKTNKKEFETKTVVAADGPMSTIATKLGLLKNKEYIKAVQYKFNAKHVKNFDNEWLDIYLKASLKGGYVWVFPRGDEYNIGVGGLATNLVEQLKNFCKTNNINPDKKKAANGGIIPFNFIFETRSKDGCIIVGDAAGLTNPSTGGGIHAALASGKIAGELIKEAFENENPETLNRYDKIIKKTPFLHPVHLKTAYYFRNWTDDDWNMFGDAADGLEMDDLTIWRSFLMGLKHPQMLIRAKEMLTIRKAMKINKKYS